MLTGQLNNLVSNGIVEDYPPLVDEKGSYTAQFEHVSAPPWRGILGSGDPAHENENESSANMEFRLSSSGRP